MKKVMLWMAGALLGLTLVTGCGSSVDENKPLDQVRTEAASMDAAKIQKHIDAINGEIKKISEKVEKEMAKIKDAAVTEIPAATAKANEAVAPLKVKLEKLGAQLKVYTDELAKKK